MDRLSSAWLALRLGIGLTASLAGLDKFFNLLAEWDRYVAPIATQMLPVPVGTFMGIVGVVEMIVGAAILTRWTRFGAYVACVWLAGVSLNLALAGFFDVAVRDAVMSVAAFTLARLQEVRDQTSTYAFERIPHEPQRVPA